MADSKEEILKAALKEFTKEGISGARTQSMADNIGVTKAMIHYYFKTKENLFKEVFRSASETLLAGLMHVLEEEKPIFQKIEQFIDEAVSRFHENPELVGFVTGELERHPEITEPIFKEASDYDASVFKKQLEEAASNYQIAPATHDQVVGNILSLCMFPCSGQKFLQGVLSIDENDQYQQYLQKRREVIKDTIINWLAG